VPAPVRTPSSRELEGQVVFQGIGGITLALRSRTEDLRLAKRNDGFAADPTQPDIHLDVSWGRLDNEPDSEALEDVGPWCVRSDDGGRVFSLKAPQLGEVPYLTAHTDADFARGEIVLHRPFYPHSQPVDPLSYPLDELLVIHHLSRGRGCELHACGIVDERGRGLLFVGQSGDGKTTLARPWSQHGLGTILSDDRIILRSENGQVVMYGTPWHGEGCFASPASAPLAGIFVLEKASHNRLHPLTRRDSTALLMARSFVPFYDSASVEGALGFLSEVSARVPCYRLSFTPDEHAVAAVQDWAGGS